MTNKLDLKKGNRLPSSLGVIGFGEAGGAFCDVWTQQFSQLKISVYDIKTDSADQGISTAKYQDYQNAGISGCKSIAEAIGKTPVVFSLVTADQACEAARSAAEVMLPDTLFFDCNSCAPDSKNESSEIIEAAGMRYVDVAVMAPVYPDPLATPMLISGPHSDDAIQNLAALGFKAKKVPGKIGRASSIKMMRSLMIKGLEALVLESLLSARKAGVEDEVIASLDASFPGWEWESRGAYCIERTTTHGIRRAAEMREVAKTVADLGLDNTMSLAIADWQQAMGDLGLPSGKFNLKSRADAILGALKMEEKL